MSTDELITELRHRAGKSGGDEVLAEAADALSERADVAACTAHRACCGSEHDQANGKLHGCCVVCGVPWPCETAQYFLRGSK